MVKKKKKGPARKNLPLTVFVSMLSLVSNHPYKSVAIRYEGDTAASLRTLIVWSRYSEITEAILVCSKCSALTFTCWEVDTAVY